MALPHAWNVMTDNDLSPEVICHHQFIKAVTSPRLPRPKSSIKCRRRLNNLARVISFFGRPVPEGRQKPVRHGRDLVRPEQVDQPLGVERLPSRRGEHERTAAFTERPRGLEDLGGPPTQRHPVLPVRLHARGGNGPDVVRRVDLVPRRQPHFARPCRRQHQELKRILGGDHRLGGSHGRKGVRPRIVR